MRSAYLRHAPCNGLYWISGNRTVMSAVTSSNLPAFMNAAYVLHLNAALQGEGRLLVRTSSRPPLPYNQPPKIGPRATVRSYMLAWKYDGPKLANLIKDEGHVYDVNDIVE